jgi:hypothetical protein
MKTAPDRVHRSRVGSVVTALVTAPIDRPAPARLGGRHRSNEVPMSPHTSSRPLALTPVRIAGIPTAIRGWVGSIRTFAYTAEPDGEGQFRALVLDGRTGSIVEQQRLGTREQAMDAARRDYLASIDPQA